MENALDTESIVCVCVCIFRLDMMHFDNMYDIDCLYITVFDFLVK